MQNFLTFTEPNPEERYHSSLERFARLGQCVVAEGWTSHADLALSYDGHPITVTTAPVKRPDLCDRFGQEAEHWGFALSGMLPQFEIDRSKITFRLNPGTTLVNPGVGTASPADAAFVQMTERFKMIVAAQKGTLLEIGSRARSGTTYRDWFPLDVKYIGLDVAAGENVDVVGDAHHLSRFIDCPVDFIFSIAVFEHLVMPWKIALEMNKVLVDGGYALIISHPAWPLHEQPWDFFRFSTDAWKGLFNSHTGFELIDAQYQFPASIVPVYANSPTTEYMSVHPTFLLSGCLVRKVGPALVAWEAEVSEIYDVEYDHR